MKNAADTFREKYQYVNQETLDAAAKESPELVLDILETEPADVLTRSLALLALAGTVREDLFLVIKSFTLNEDPLIRESAFIGLFNYYDAFEKRHLELKDYFQQKLQTETSIGVRTRLTDILGMME